MIDHGGLSGLREDLGEKRPDGTWLRFGFADVDQIQDRDYRIYSTYKNARFVLVNISKWGPD